MDKETSGLSVPRNLKIAVFHLGSGMADVLTTGVWNRIMISDLGMSATPVSLLVSLRYFLAPLGVWAGRMSDTQRVLGLRRLFWIWLGRLFMVLSTFGLGYATTELARNGTASDSLAWLIIVASMILFSLGSAISGSTFLSLIYDRAKPEQRGRAVGIVWTFLLLGFTIGGIVFSILLPHEDGAGLSFSPDALLNLFFMAGGGFFVLWFFSLLGEETQSNAPLNQDVAAETSLKADLALVWQNPALRFFLFYLTLSMFFAFAQDPILEPFAGDVFGMSANVTNRFAAYWGTTSILGTIVFLWLSRKIPRLTNTVTSQMGVAVLILSFALFTLSALLNIRALMSPNLLLLGLGLGMWNVGTLGLMMDMSPVGRAGTFLGFWSMAVTLARGGGITFGGIGRDTGLQLFGSSNLAYGLVFGLAAIGLGIAAYCLNRVHVEDFKEESFQDTATLLAGAMD